MFVLQLLQINRSETRPKPGRITGPSSHKNNCTAVLATFSRTFECSQQLSRTHSLSTGETGHKL